MFYEYNEEGEIIGIQDSTLLAEIGEYRYERWQRYNNTRVKQGYYPLSYEEYVVNVIANGDAEAEKNSQDKKALEYRRSMDEFKVFIREGFGSFYLYNFNNVLQSKLEKNYLFRFIKLCDSMDYNNRVKLKRDTLAEEKDLKDIWNLSDRETRNTKKALIEAKLIIIEEDKTITINKKFARKGETKSKKYLEGCVKVFPNAIEELYQQVPTKNHKNVALLFELLPYCNFHHNVICTKESVEERDIKKIKPLTMKDISEIIGYDKSQSSRLQKNLLDIKIGKEDCIIIVLRNKQHFIYINPRIYHKTSNLDDLKALMNMFRINGNW